MHLFVCLIGIVLILESSLDDLLKFQVIYKQCWGGYFGNVIGYSYKLPYLKCNK